MASTAPVSQADARAAIFYATVEMLKLNEKVGNSLPAEIVQCVDGRAEVNTTGQIISIPNPSSSATNAAGQGGGARRTRHIRHRRAHRKTQIRRHK